AMTAKVIAGAFLTILFSVSLSAQEKLKTETFDTDPNWEGHNNRPKHEPRSVRQDFGYSPDTSHAGGAGKGEMGGFICSAAEPAYYAVPLDGVKTFDDKLTASGTFSVGPGGQHLLIGFFNNQT